MFGVLNFDDFFILFIELILAKFTLVLSLVKNFFSLQVIYLYISDILLQSLPLRFFFFKDYLFILLNYFGENTESLNDIWQKRETWIFTTPIVNFTLYGDSLDYGKLFIEEEKKLEKYLHDIIYFLTEEESKIYEEFDEYEEFGNIISEEKIEESINFLPNTDVEELRKNFKPIISAKVVEYIVTDMQKTLETLNYISESSCVIIDSHNLHIFGKINKVIKKFDKQDCLSSYVSYENKVKNNYNKLILKLNNSKKLISYKLFYNLKKKNLNFSLKPYKFINKKYFSDITEIYEKKKNFNNIKIKLKKNDEFYILLPNFSDLIENNNSVTILNLIYINTYKYLKDFYLWKFELLKFFINTYTLEYLYTKVLSLFLVKLIRLELFNLNLVKSVDNYNKFWNILYSVNLDNYIYVNFTKPIRVKYIMKRVYSYYYLKLDIFLYTRKLFKKNFIYFSIFSYYEWKHRNPVVYVLKIIFWKFFYFFIPKISYLFYISSYFLRKKISNRYFWNLVWKKISFYYLTINFFLKFYLNKILQIYINLYSKINFYSNSNFFIFIFNIYNFLKIFFLTNLFYIIKFIKFFIKKYKVIFAHLYILFILFLEYNENYNLVLPHIFFIFDNFFYFPILFFNYIKNFTKKLLYPIKFKIISYYKKILSYKNRFLNIIFLIKLKPKRKMRKSTAKLLNFKKWFELIENLFFFMYDKDLTFTLWNYFDFILLIKIKLFNLIHSILLYILYKIRQLNSLKVFFLNFLKMNLFNLYFRYQKYGWHILPYVNKKAKIKRLYDFWTEGVHITSNFNHYFNYKGFWLINIHFFYVDLRKWNFIGLNIFSKIIRKSIVPKRNHILYLYTYNTFIMNFIVRKADGLKIWHTLWVYDWLTKLFIIPRYFYIFTKNFKFYWRKCNKRLKKINK